MSMQREESIGCPHLVAVFADNNRRTSFLDRYCTVVRWNVNRYQEVSYSIKRRKISPPQCSICNIALSRVYACLHCPVSCCWDGGHIKDHLQDTGHDFCADVKTGNVYCVECDDFIYDRTINRQYASVTLSAEEKASQFQDKSKRGREPFTTWYASAQELTLLRNTTPSPCHGRRGLINLGQTCFMNVILQSLIANPLLRNYYLSDKHNSKLCKLKDCTSCEMDKLFSEVHSDNSSPYGPIDLLAKTWRISSELCGYAQQDAHEFFIAALNQIHATCRGSTSLQCICVIHSTFAGLLQSDVKCERCGKVADKTDPMLDISLELKGENGTEQNLTLASCLRRYTHPEKLGPNEYSCEKCGKASHASKRLSIRKLPPVLSFQFKRFEHKTADKSAARKIEAPVRFPASLNMAPFTTLVMHKQEQIKDNVGPGGASLVPDKSLGPETTYEYDLFAVVCHEGQIDNGHYTCYARSKDEWYRYDDDKVSHATLAACLAAQAYMCFYVKRHLDYRPYVTPSYVVTREQEAVKEREREREKAAALAREVDDELLAAI
ncbi:cysteine proteinase [Epithele typhae]|uniref:cysteine proteinase n=1 Tax=Epithele typhae TaxID=378194 RepID=UPI0020084986|nr:cysteine proteinase [Epithele typhae]KAH9945406.1 cysteine proteinase [Epithele typhae]